MMQKVTMLDVAKAANVSKSTVSQYINKRYEYMGEETRKKIKEAIDTLGYQPNYLARSLKQKRTSMIGIIVANIMHRFSTEVIRAIEDYCHSQDIHAIICNADDDPDKEKKYINMLKAKQVDGLILFPTGANTSLYEQMIKEEYPVVIMDRKIHDVKGKIPSVVANNQEATKQAILHLLDLGHKHIAIITEPLTITPRIERVEGYKEALTSANMPVNESMIINCKKADMQKALEKLFAADNPPTALLAGNDLVFIEVQKFIKQHGFNIPNDLSLIVYDNIPYADVATPAVTTISQPAFDMGTKAADLLIKQILKEKIAYEEYQYECELIIRETTLSH
ncbi:LacI family DNA-binding transcriptional regulator [Priestia megaterium]|jgi:LacI family kdg operon repressor|uniref:LacI family DNA-binding transcriptional regulator n=1 Tax=Priestia megaterium TaxID=1404 RepID=UPI001866E384|nr:substrate-binding domain-containing protein [Priestia megaterium]MBE2973598.1 substrate-binding domain-containing protein [Priestia megaterium]MBT2254934.1 substrate-binding domain-containing protein [Priestia megaterium]MBT2278919.1 substrate-binding domain-containing protein [Priestia megaterium]MCY9019016.1 substrate-binding domain-containing protein [Priestia megaterium]MCY9025874.1 substrate-binding domain-containing protein [Priestia megaterium]